ncbi:MAG: lipopolysaccharide transport periplasmic protein LptA [Burkholderiales bacterium]|nr:lipopolysaccharide transport periplasmic protein LptA [Burkholderiales bacterium]
MKKIILFSFLIICGGISYCLKNDANMPLQIEANQATVDQKNLVSIFKGNVVITKGSLIVHAESGIAMQDKQGNRTIILTGIPVTFEQQQDDGTTINGQCDKFQYNTKTNLAILTGRARIKKEKNEVIGDVLSYNTQTQVYSARSNFANGVKTTTSGRVTVILDQGLNNGSSK